MSIRLNLSTPIAILVLAISSAPVAGQTLYGASNGLPGGAGLSDLYTIDPSTGAATLVGPIGFENVTGSTCLPDGRLVASARDDAVVPPGPAAIFLEIDPATGAGSLIGTIGDLNAGECARMPDITYDSVSGNLFAYGDFCPTPIEGLHTVDAGTGAGTSVGPSGYSGGGNGLAVLSALLTWPMARWAEGSRSASRFQSSDGRRF